MHELLKAHNFFSHLIILSLELGWNGEDIFCNGNTWWHWQELNTRTLRIWFRALSFLKVLLRKEETRRRKKAQLPVKLQPRSLEPIVPWSIVSLEQQQQQCCWILRLFSKMYSRDCDVNSLNLDARAASLSRSETGWSKIRLKVKVSSQRSLLKNKINFKLLLMRCDRIPSLRKSSVCFSQTRQESSRLKKGSGGPFCLGFI